MQQTVLRLRGMSLDVPQAPAPTVVCNEEHRFLTANQLQEIGVDRATILLEPVGRNTAPALTIAALQAVENGGNPIMLAMPADHVMDDLSVFQRAVQDAYLMALENQVVIFGVTPDRPETGYGYIQASARQNLGHGRVDSFVEKPDSDFAEKLLRQDNTFWNSGIFVLSARTWLQLLKYFRPDILKACAESMQLARRDVDFIRPSREKFSECPSDSIDYAVMEQLPNNPDIGIALSMVILNAGWSDVGAWSAVWGCGQKDPQGNVAVGSLVVPRECTNSLFLSSGRLVACVGLDNVVVIETPDAVLVAEKSKTQDIKNLVEYLADEGRMQAHTHRKVYRPWGWYDCLERGESYQVKRILVNPKASLSLQMHQHRAEHWVVVCGTAEVTNGSRTYVLAANQSTYIPAGQRHRLANPLDVPLEIIEVQSGSYLGEDDIVRFDDIYGRID